MNIKKAICYEIKIKLKYNLKPISDEKVNLDRVRFFFFFLKLNVVMSFPALSLGFPVFVTYFIFDVTSKLGFPLNFQFKKNPKKQDFEFGKKPK